MKDLLSQCQSTYGKIQEWREVPDAFDLQSDRLYLHELLVELQDKARQLGCQIESIHDPTIDQALNAVAFIIEWCKSQDEQQGNVDHDGPYSVPEAAILTRISKEKLYQDCREGKIDCTRNPYRITKEALEQYLEDRRRPNVKTTGFRHLT